MNITNTDIYEEQTKELRPVMQRWRFTGKVLAGSPEATVCEVERASGQNKRAVLKTISISAPMSDLLGVKQDILDIVKTTASCKDCDTIAQYTYSAAEDVRNDDGKTVAYNILLESDFMRSLTQRDFSIFPEEYAVKLGMDMCRALKAAHSKRLIHGSIQPSNIYITEDDRFLLGDFGISMLFAQNNSEETLRYLSSLNDSSVIEIIDDISLSIIRRQSGTEKRMDSLFRPPESPSGCDYDESSDLYSLGLVIYTCLNGGYLPFEDEDKIDYVTRRLNGEIIPPPQSGSDALKAVVMKACSFNKQYRYHRAGAMLRDICAIAGVDTDADDADDNDNCAEDNRRTSAALPDSYKTVIYRSGIYTGELDGGKRNGNGTMHYRTGDMYEGEWSDGLQHGYGVYTWANGDIYDGFWVNHVRQGTGKYLWSNGDTYDGEWNGGVRCGHGVMRFANGDVYNGQWENDVRCGYGEVERADGICFRCMWKNDMPQGSIKPFRKYNKQSNMSG